MSDKTSGIVRLWRNFKKNPGVWPVTFFGFGIGPVLITIIVWHKLKGPEVFWRSDPEPWNKYDNTQIKLWSSFSVNDYHHPRPRFIDNDHHDDGAARREKHE